MTDGTVSAEASDFVVLLARARSGTHPLREVLGSHPAIFATPEVFHADPLVESDVQLAERVNFFRFLEDDPATNVSRGASSERQEAVFLGFLDHLREISSKRHIVIDVKYNSTHHFDGPWRPLYSPPALFELIERHGLRVLHLTRRNYLRSYLSVTKARLTETWFAEEPAGDSAIPVDIPEMLRYMSAWRGEDQIVARALDGHPRRLTAEYDEVFRVLDGGPSDEFLTEAGDWLSIDPTQFDRRPPFRKQSALPLSEAITNYDAVEDALRGTAFEHCLEDERIYRHPPADPPGQGEREVGLHPSRD